MTLLTPREAAARLGVSYPTVKQWIYKGSIRTRRTAGGHHRVPATEIDRLLARTGRALPPPRRGGAAIVTLSGRNQLRGVVEEVRVEGLSRRCGSGWVIRLYGDHHPRCGRRTGAHRGDEALAVVKATEVMIAGQERTWARAKRESTDRNDHRERSRLDAPTVVPKIRRLEGNGLARP